MKIEQKLIIIIFTLFIGQTSLSAFSNFNTIVSDTIPEVEQVYKGNRIMVKGIKISKRKGKSVKITYNLKNTGRNKVKLGKKRVIPSDLIIEFDGSLVKNDLEGTKLSLIENLKKQDISIRPGQLIIGEKLKFENKTIPPSDRITKVENIEENGKQISTPDNQKYSEDIIEKSSDIATEIITSEPVEKIVDTPETPIEEVVEITTTETPVEEVAEIITTETPVKEVAEITTTETPVKEVAEITTTETPTEEVVEITTTETPGEKVVEITTTEIPVEEVAEITTTETPAEEVAEITTTETQVEEVAETESPEEFSTDKIEEKQCPDLAVVSVKILKKSKRNVTLKYTITNTGNIPISLLGKTKKEEDNISIQVYFTRSEKLTRGAIPIKSFYLKKGLKGKGLLEPNGSYSGKIKVETSKVTKFTPVLALSIDPNEDTNECTRINNVSFVNITENAAPKSNDPLPIQPLEAKENEIIGSNLKR